MGPEGLTIVFGIRKSRTSLCGLFLVFPEASPLNDPQLSADILSGQTTDQRLCSSK